MNVIPLLVRISDRRNEFDDETRDRPTYDQRVYESLLLCRVRSGVRSTLVTRVRNETTDDN